MKKNCATTIKNTLLKSKNKAFRFFEQKEYLFAFALIVIVLILFGLSRNYQSLSDIGQGATIEMFGLLFDVLLFGVLLEIYNKTREKKLAIQRYQEELDDYRGWKEKEAGYRIFGLMKRLKALGENNLDLTLCYFEDAQFSRDCFHKFDFDYVKLHSTIVRSTSFKDVVFNQGKFESIDFSEAKMQNVKFVECEFGENVIFPDNMDSIEIIQKETHA